MSYAARQMTSKPQQPESPNAGFVLLATLVLCIGLMPSVAGAQLLEAKPENLEGVGVDQNLGAQIPLDLEFLDSTGESVTLGQLFDEGQPILLTLNYSSCPRLCRVQLNGLFLTLSEMELSAGKEFTLVSVSINPNETALQAFDVKQRYLDEYNRPDTENGLRFLTGNEENIKQLADTVGFRYFFDEKRNEYSHAASLMVCSPEGVVCRYLNGVKFDAKTVRLSLVEASEGKVGTVIDQFLLFCFHYDETEGRYGPVARRLMAAGGAATVFVLGLTLVPYWMKSSRRDSAADSNTDTDPITSPADGNDEAAGSFA